jgi:SAM-dependent methyltransferase
MNAVSTHNPNQDQIDFWNSQVAQKWVDRQDDIDAMLAPFTAALLGAADLGPQGPWRILDVGCGAGETALLAGDIGHHVTGIDVSKPLLDLAKRRGAAAGLRDVQFFLGDASRVFIDPPFDLVMSRFGVMFFHDPVAAFTNLAKLLVPSGRLVCVCWQAPDQNQWVRVPLQALGEALGEAAFSQSAMPATGPGPFAFANRADVRQILAKAGFGAIKITPVRGDMRIGQGGGLAEALAFLTEIGPAARATRDLNPAQKRAFETSLRSLIAPLMQDDQLVLEGAVWLVEATKQA